MKTKRNSSNKIHIEEINTQKSWKEKGMACVQAEGKKFSELMRSLVQLKEEEEPWDLQKACVMWNVTGESVVSAAIKQETDCHSAEPGEWERGRTSWKSRVVLLKLGPSQSVLEESQRMKTVRRAIDLGSRGEGGREQPHYWVVELKKGKRAHCKSVIG